MWAPPAVTGTPLRAWWIASSSSRDSGRRCSWPASASAQPETVPATPGNRVLAGVEIQRGGVRGAAAGVDRVDAAVRFADQPEAVATDAGHVWIDHGQAGGGGDCGFDRAAAIAQHVAAGLRGEVVGRNDEAATGAQGVQH
jgi:hypothetical protein